MRVAQWTVFETEFKAALDYKNSVQDVEVAVDFTSPSGRQVMVLAFWDGGTSWKVRFSPDERGNWTFQTRCMLGSDSGLEQKTGGFTCVRYSGRNPLYRHGAVRVSKNLRHFMHADGTPFFHMADTAWNGALLSTDKEWGRYVADRSRKGFNAVQFVATQWLAGAGNAEGRQAYYGRERIAIDAVFFKRLDARIASLNAAGMVASPVLCWAATWNSDALLLNPGTSLPDDQIVLLVKYMAARFGAFHVIWYLAGDGDYRGESSTRWQKIGREVFTACQKRPASLHPGGLTWIGDAFRTEPWFDFTAYQSGHSSHPNDLRWLVEGPPSADWKSEPAKPLLNAEPNYEAHRDWNTNQLFGDMEVRRASYWSLLVHPPAGVTYGAHGIWSWERTLEIPMNHLGAGGAKPWFEAVKLPGATCMKHLKHLFSSLRWWTLVPAQEWLAEQPGSEDPRLFIAVARSSEGRWAIAYMPGGRTVRLVSDAVRGFDGFRWFNPRTGKWTPVQRMRSESFLAPDSLDWVLWLGATASAGRERKA